MKALSEDVASGINPQTNILVVDDNPNFCSTLKKIFHKKGLYVEIVNSGKEAINLLESTQFDLVILDLQLPDMSGSEVVDHIVTIRPELMVIMVTGHASVESAIKAINKNVVAYITKPLDIDKLLITVSNTLERQALLRQKNEAERALQESEIRFRVLAEESPQGIIIMMEDGIKYANKSTSDIFGYLIDQILKFSQEKIWNCIHPMDRDRLFQLYSDYESNIPMNPRAQFRIIRPNGTLRSVEASSAIVKWEGEDAIEVIIIDRTSEEKAQEIRNQYQKEIEIYNSLLRHDLANDLQLILSELELIQLCTSDLPENASLSLRSAISSAERMNELIKSLQKPEDDIEQRIVFLLQYYAGQFSKTEPALTITIIPKNEAESLIIRGSRLLPMVFTNLITNTIKHVGKEGKIELIIHKDDDKAIVDFIDDGPGVSPIVLGKLFERGASTTGGGLGLYLSKLILEAIGGSIEYIPEKNLGAHFRVILPLESELDT